MIFSKKFNLQCLYNKILSAITAHPKIVTLGIGLAITFVIGTAIGMVENNSVFAIIKYPT